MTTTYTSNYTELINNIKNIQTEEQQIIDQLNQIPADNYSLNYQKQLVDRYNNLEAIKATSYTELQWAYDSLYENNQNQALQIQDQVTELQLLDKMLQDAQNEMAVNKNLNVGNLRMSEINTYYSEKYRYQANIISKLILFCLPLLILVLLKSKDIISA